MERAFGTISSIVRNLEENSAVEKAFVLATWKEAAGPQLASRAVPIDYLDGRLIVAVADATWKQHLEALASRLLAKLNSLLDGPAVRFLEFREQPTQFAEAENKRTWTSDK